MCEACWRAKSWRPALLGRYWLIALFQLVGSVNISGGRTKKMAANAAIPPAVLRTIAPIASAKIADEHHVDGAADHRARDARLRERDLELRNAA